MKMLLDSFIFSNFNYCPLVWHFCSAALSQEIEVKDLTSLPKFTEFIKTLYRPECRCANSRVTHITILELHTLLCICPSGNLIPNIKNQNIKRNETVAFLFLVCTRPLGFIFILFFFLFILVSDLIGSVTVFIVQNLIFLSTLLVNN